MAICPSPIPRDSPRLTPSYPIHPLTINPTMPSLFYYKLSPSSPTPIATLFIGSPDGALPPSEELLRISPLFSAPDDPLISLRELAQLHPFFKGEPKR